MALHENYTKHAMPPESAMKTITGGDLKGMTDIKPQWRYEALTDLYGMCGLGWKYELLSNEVHEVADGEKIVNVIINFYTVDGQGAWSDPIPAMGGSKLIMKTNYGLKSNDEAFKMALTDAISTACSKLGIAGDVYLGKVGKVSTGSKYEASASAPAPAPAPAPKPVSNEPFNVGSDNVGAYLAMMGAKPDDWINLCFKTGHLTDLGRAMVSDIQNGKLVVTDARAIRSAGYKISNKDWDILQKKVSEQPETKAPAPSDPLPTSSKPPLQQPESWDDVNDDLPF